MYLLLSQPQSVGNLTSFKRDCDTIPFSILPPVGLHVGNLTSFKRDCDAKVCELIYEELKLSRKLDLI